MNVHFCNCFKRVHHNPRPVHKVSFYVYMFNECVHREYLHDYIVLIWNSLWLTFSQYEYLRHVKFLWHDHELSKLKFHRVFPFHDTNIQLYDFESHHPPIIVLFGTHSILTDHYRKLLYLDLLLRTLYHSIICGKYIISWKEQLNFLNGPHLLLFWIVFTLINVVGNNQIIITWKRIMWFIECFSCY